VREHELPEIRKLPLFRDMAEESFAALMQVAYAQSFPPQLDLVHEGEPADFLHIIMDGAVELYACWKGRESTMAMLRPVSTFILAACIKDAPYLMSARTLARSRVILIPAVDLRAVFRRDPGFAVSTINELAACYRGVVRHNKNLKLRNSRERIAAYVLRKAGERASFTLPVEKRQLASYLGMTPENLSRAMRALAEDGMKVDGQRIIITNRAALERVAEVTPLLDGPAPAAEREASEAFAEVETAAPGQRGLG
jgi:CRP/FNR family transcriptional regulator, transcriptional activator FtrB